MKTNTYGLLKSLLLLFLALLFMNCAKVSDNEKTESPKVFRLGVNGSTEFKNILFENPVRIDDNEYYTNYGHGEIVFNIDSKTEERFAIFSVPADEEVETYFTFEIGDSLKYELNSHFILCTYKENNPKNFTIYSADGQNLGYVPLLEEAVKNKFIVKASGIFEKYEQENFVVFGVDTSHIENKEDLTTHIDTLKDSTKNLFKENSAYVVAYPWRTIKVAFFEETPGARPLKQRKKYIDVEDYISMDYLNEIFAQAICKIEVADSASDDYDCEIIMLDMEKDFAFYDETDKEFSTVNSNSLKYAKVKNLDERNLAYVIAYLLGVSYFEDKDESKTITENLMNPNGDGTHLSFRQWNQLHIREKK